ncbi:spore gernimation protein [Paenibacillus antri]|uniref:Spore gernimation protein n=1 Tax=Paenibacillus antri TaxID=2582848 RepID=A0A5R9GKS0_9BACL|nr:endospore germination permease [Paenibacillus antri]TLS52335.1 spore gernimation protein [Paenibacillus antri]
MNTQAKITALQLYFIMMLSIGVTNHVLLAPVLLSVAKRDAWVGSIAAVVPSVLFAIILTYAARKTGDAGALERLRSRFGPFVASIAGAAAAGYAFLLLVVTLKDVATWTRVSYLPMTPLSAIAFVFVTICAFAANAGIRAIAICSGLLLPIVIVLGDFVAAVNFQFKDYSLLFPLFTHGYVPAGKAALYTFAGTMELSLMLFLQRHVSTAVGYRGMIVLCAVLVFLATGPLMGAIAIYGPFESAELRYPPFEQWRMVSLGKFITHLDFLSIFQWLSGAFIRLSLFIFLIADVCFREDGRKRRAMIVLTSAAALATATLLPIGDIELFRFLLKEYFPISIGFSAILFAIVLASVWFGKRNEAGGVDNR